MRRTWILVSALVIGSAGCNHGERRREEVDPSTVGRTRSLYPRGSTIPPAGFGVDLVRRKGATIDPSAAPASAPE